MFDSASIIQPRALGQAFVASKVRGVASVIDDLHQSGCMRVLFPRAGTTLDAVLINTSGGVTGGDVISFSARVGQGSSMTITTQAAERAYRAQHAETARITNEINVEAGAALRWLPQEMILYNRCNLDRRLNVTLAATATALMVETVVFGRAAMRETLDDIQFRDRISITRGGTPLYLDGISMAGDGAAQLAQTAVASGGGAMASVVYVAPDAESHARAVRALLPTLGGASMLGEDVLVIRVIASDSFELRKSLVPILERLSNAPLPKSWRL